MRQEKDRPYNTPLTKNEGEAYKKGGRVGSMKSAISKLHSNVLKDAPMKKLKATTKYVDEALPHDGKRVSAKPVSPARMMMTKGCKMAPGSTKASNGLPAKRLFKGSPRSR